jgi:hypothetical protein
MKSITRTPVKLSGMLKVDVIVCVLAGVVAALLLPLI